MASSYSFDIVSEVNMQEVDNAVNQAKKEVLQRYDLKNSNTEINFDPKEKVISIQADGEHFVNAVYEIIQSKCFKRGISVLSLEAGKPEFYGGKAVRMKVTLKNGISKEDAKKITQIIKDGKLKVTTQIQDEQVRVTGKDKDELQKTISLVRGADLDFPVQFINMR